MGQDSSKKQTNNELPVPPANVADQISKRQGTSVDQLSGSIEHLKVKDNIVSLSQPDKQISSAVTEDTGVSGRSDGTELLYTEAQQPGGVEIHTAMQQGPEDVDMSDEEESLKKSLYNGDGVFPSQDGKESWQDLDGNISNLFPPEDVPAVYQTSLAESVNREPLNSRPDNKQVVEEDIVEPNIAPTLDMQDDKGDNQVHQEKDRNPSMAENASGPATNLNGLSPAIKDAYTEFQALFSYVNDLKLSNRRIMKKLTDEQQRYKKTCEDSEAKVSGLEECVTFLEERVGQREGQIRKFKGIIQVLLQKVSHLTSALGNLPGNNGQGKGSEAPPSEEEEGEEEEGEEEEGEEEDLEKKYMLPKPMTDKAKMLLPNKHQVSYRVTKATPEGTDNRPDYIEPHSSKVLRRAVRERSKATMTGSLIKPAEASSNTGAVRQKGQRVQKAVSTPQTRKPKPRKTQQRQVPIQNEFRNTLTEVTKMTKETSSVPVPYSMDLSSWIQEANLEIIKGAESSSATGRGPNVVLCLDISQSMEGAPFFNMVQGVLKYIDGVENIKLSLGFQINLAIVTFGHKTGVIQHLTNELSVLRETVRNLTTGGTSPLTAALLMSTAASIGHSHRVTTGGYVQRPRIIIFTDGRATLESRLIGEDVPLDGDFSYEIMNTMMSVVEDIKNRKFTISYVPVGNFYSRYMEQIAERTGGKRYPMGQLDKAIRYNKNFAFAMRLMPYIKEATGGNLKDEHANRLILTSVASNDQFVTKEDEEDILEILSKADDLEKVPGSDSDDDEGHRELEHDMPPLGSRVRRGPDWSWDDQDSNMAGTVVSHKSDGWLWVTWDSGHRNQYCYGKGGKYDVIPVDEPRTIKPGESIQIGCMVKRGPDWNKGNKDGGKGSMGSVIHIYPNKTLLVRWPSKEMLDHNYGCDGKFEVTMCDPSEQLALMMEASYGGGATGGATWGATGGSDEKGSSSIGSGERDKMPDKENDEYITKLNKLNQRNVSLETDTPLSEQSGNIPRRRPDRPSGQQSSSERPHSEKSLPESSQTKVPHSEVSPPESSLIECSDQSDRLSADHQRLLKGNRANIAGVSPTTGHNDGVMDNITGGRVDRHRPGEKSNPNHHSSSGGIPSNLPHQGDKLGLPHAGAKLDPPQSEGNSGVRNTRVDTTPLLDAAVEPVGKVTWQYKDEYGGWTCYSEENSSRIEKIFKANKGMLVINGGKHRILLAKMMQVHTTTKYMTAVRRQIK